eukprot:TRINITY_DN9302_c0_g1_i1.p1 TRINITY_DN9302_c0_g1~~TRINITY_DN9302_c0_g1_i1.p1  ORF type:complete len:562 (+),score=104.05 TRINITY_DN9302_c0_g1_i1:59-1744(+)
MHEAEGPAFTLGRERGQGLDVGGCRPPARRDPKRGVDQDVGRKRRHDGAVTLRNRARDDALASRRRQQPETPPPRAAFVPPTGPALSTWPVEELVSKFGVVAGAVASGDPACRLEAVLSIRRILAAPRPAVDAVAAPEHCIVPRLIECVCRPDLPELQCEAAWCLSNLAGSSSARARAVAFAGAVQPLAAILHQEAAPVPVKEQAAWCLGSIASEGAQMREHVLGHGCAVPLLRILVDQQGQPTLRRNAAWVISNLCATRGPEADDLVRLALPVVATLLHDQDEEVRADACWCVAHICDHGPDHTQAVLAMAAGSIPKRLAQLLAASVPSLQIPVLRAIGNVCAGTDEHTQCMIDLGVLPMLCYLLAHVKKAVRREVCWVISNITAGTREHIQACFEANLLPPLILSAIIHEFDVRKEAAWALCNATKKGTANQLRFLVLHGVVPPLVELLSAPDDQLLLVALEGLRLLLAASEAFRDVDSGANIARTQIVVHGGVERVEELQRRSDARVYRTAVSILEQYFDAEPCDDMQPLEPVVVANSAGGGTFQFGLPEAPLSPLVG